jgi:hypothetical protein
MNKTLNEALNEAKYPEFTNRLFDCLVIPFGGVQNKNFKGYKGYNSSNDAEFDCLEEDIYDSLLNLAKYKLPKILTKKKAKKAILKDKTKTQKNAKKREKIINQMHSTSYH